MSTTYTTGPTFIQINFTGQSTPGSISVPGVQVGDVVLWLSNGAGNNNVGGFEESISVADEIQQNASGGSWANPFMGYLMRWAQQ